MTHPSASPFRLLCSPAFICLLLALAVFAVYAPVRNYGFVDYDDSGYYFANAHVLGGLTLPNIKWAFISGEDANWHPLTWLSLMLDATLFGKGAAAPHITNVLLHAANSILLFLLLLRTTSHIWRSAAVAMLFAIHPLHVESVAWISERKDVLSGFFGLLTLLCYAGYAGKQDKNRWLEYGLALLFFVCGLLSKPMVVTLPFVMLLMDYWPLERLSPSSIARLLLEKIPFFILCAAASVVTFLVQQKGGATSLLTKISLAGHIENAFVSYARYLGKIFFPFNLAALYPVPAGWPVLFAFFSIVLFSFLSVAAIVAGRKIPWVFTGWFWFAGMLIPVIGLVQVGFQVMADRYVYLPIIGILIILVWGAGEIFAQSRAPRSLAVVLAASLFFACGLRARNQVAVWQNDGTLFGHDVAVTKNNYIASLKFAFWCSQNGRDQDALRYYDEALQMTSNDPTARSFSGRKGIEDVFYRYYSALRLNPDDPTEFYNMGNSFARLGDWDEAVREYERALQIKPDEPDVLDNLGFALVHERQFSAAVTNFQAAIKLKPDSFGAHDNLASVLYVQGRYREAAEEFQKALRLDPGDESFCINLAETYIQLGQTNQAVKYYKQALTLRPGDPHVLANLEKLGIH